MNGLAGKVAALAFLSLSCGVVRADSIKAHRDAKGTPVRPGHWHAGLTETKNYAEANGLPLFAVWSKGGDCSHCLNFEKNMLSPAFMKWMEQSGIVFMYSCITEDKTGTTVPEWCRSSNDGSAKLTSLPFVRLHWVRTDPKTGKKATVVSKAYWGGKLTKEKGQVYKDMEAPEEFIFHGDKGTYNQGGRYAINFLTNGVNGVLREFFAKPPEPVFAGGNFVTTNAPNACLQVLAGTTSLSVPVVRTATAECEQTMKIASSAKAGEKTFTWAAGETFKLVDIADIKGYYVKGQKITLQLMGDEEDAQVVSETIVDCLAEEPENASVNPYWIGEKTADELAFGEWTMDLSVLTNKVATFNRQQAQVKSGGAAKRAYAMVLVSGSRWCPDCVAADEYLFDRPEFGEWARNNNVALGVVDIPNYNSVDDGPSLLSYETSVTSERFVTVNGSKAADENLRLMSGAGYLSRKGIPHKDATNAIARSAWLVGANTLDGGLKNPGAKYDAKRRVGVPQLILLRDDGTVAGRFNTFSNFGPQAWNEAYLARLSEFLAQTDDSDEEANDYARTAEATTPVPMNGSISGCTLGHADLADYYPIPKSAGGNRIGVTLSGDRAAAVALSFVQVSGTNEVTLTSLGPTNLTDIASEVLDLRVPTGGSCFLKVSMPTDSYGNPVGEFAVDSDKSATVGYSLSSQTVIVPDETARTAEGLDGREAIVSIEEEKTYKFTNLDDASESVKKSFEKTPDGNYRATVTDTVRLTLLATEFSYQLWRTGSIGFRRASAKAKETSQRYVLEVRRTGGSSGKAAARINLDKDLSTKLEEIWDEDEWMKNWEGHEMSWGEGDSQTVYSFPLTIIDNPYKDEDQKIVFRLTGLPESEAGLDQKEFTLVVENDDTSKTGRIGITGCGAGLAKSMTAIAKGGSTIQVEFMRYDGADGAATATLSANNASLDTSSLDWEAREAGADHVKTVNVTLPAYDPLGSHFASVKVLTSTGAGVDYLKRTLTVDIVPETAPEFETPAKTFKAGRYVMLSAVDSRVQVTNAGEKTSVVKYSGSLPSGVTWSYKDGWLVFSGAPTRAGTFSAVFRAKENGVSGLTFTATFVVVDPTASPSSGAGSPLNPNAAKARTINDILYLDEETGRLEAVLTLSISPNGKLSARCGSEEGTFSFASKRWSRMTNVVDLVAVLEPTSSKWPYGPFTVTVPAAADSTIQLENENGWIADLPIEWSDPRCKSSGLSAANFKGYYTVSLGHVGAGADSESNPLCTGDAYLTLKMTTSLAVRQGKMTFAGLLPNGKAVSGSATVTPHNWDDDLKKFLVARVPVSVLTSTDSFSSVLTIDPDASNPGPDDSRCSVRAMTDVVPAWHHFEKGVNDASYVMTFNAYGTYYNGADAKDLLSCCDLTFGTRTLAFFAQTDALKGLSCGDPDAWLTNGLTMTVGQTSAGVSRISLDNPRNAAGLTLSFNPSTGIVSGSFKLSANGGLTTKSMTYRGILLPGFGTKACEDCDYGDNPDRKRPFISGAAWLSDVFRYSDAGRERTRSVKRGCPISVGLYEGL